MRSVRSILPFLLSLFFCATAQVQWWEVRTSGMDSNLRGISVAEMPDAKGLPVPVVWASGSNGVILKSVDEGKSWKQLHVTSSDALDFRGIVAWSEKMAYVMSSGEGEKSRIYKTTDGGETWKLQYTDKRKEFFLDAIACFSEKDCVALSDPVDGKFLLLSTTDGEHWNALPGENMPPALPSEGAFAASNTCLALSEDEDNEVFFGTGGPAARVFHTMDRGLTWTVVETPITHGNPSSGIFSLGLGENHRVIAMGGDYKQPDRTYRNATYSIDGGKTWQLSAQQPGGYRSSLARIDGGDWVAVGPSGEDISDDYAAHWKHTDSLNLNAVALLDVFTGWAVGPNGTIARFINHRQYEIHHRRPHRRQQPLGVGVAD